MGPPRNKHGAYFPLFERRRLSFKESVDNYSNHGAFGTLFGDDYKLSAAFLIFLFLTLYSLHFVNRYVPETKGLTLQQIQSFLRPAT